MVNIKENYEYWDGEDLVVVPEHLVGLWITKLKRDLSFISFTEAVNTEEWIKCEKVEVVTYEYKEKL